MAQRKYVSLSKLSTFLDNLKKQFATITHRHTISEITDYTIDSSLSSTSINPVQNKVIDAEFEAVSTAMNALDLAIDRKADVIHTHKATAIQYNAPSEDIEIVARGTLDDALTSIENEILNLQGVAATKQATVTGAATTITDSNLTANRALVSNSSGKVVVSAVTSTELGYLDGVTSNVQTQLNGKVAAVSGKGLSTNDFTNAYKTKLDEITNSADSVSFSCSLTSGTKVGTITINGTGIDLYAPTNTDTDTHYTSMNVVGATNATTNTTTALTNGNVYLNSVENGVVTSTHKISGSGATTVTTDANGNIIISSNDDNTTYNAAGSSLGLVKSGGDVTISSGVITVNDDSHNHTISNIDNLQSSLDAKVSTSRTVNGKALSANITLTASDVNAYSKTEIDNLELITIQDIDTICGSTIQVATVSEVTF